MRIKAAVLYRQGLPRPYAGSLPLVVEEVELDPPGPGEILIEVAAAGLCHSDLSTIENQRPRPLPIVIGHEGAGIVREVGEGIADLKPGDHVITVFAPSFGIADTACAGGRTSARPAMRRARWAVADRHQAAEAAGGTPINHNSGLSPLCAICGVARARR